MPIIYQMKKKKKKTTNKMYRYNFFYLNSVHNLVDTHIQILQDGLYNYH